jgi:WD40 repeat protein
MTSLLPPGTTATPYLKASPGGPSGLCARLWRYDHGSTSSSSGSCVALRTLTGHTSLVMCTVFCPSGTMLATGAADCSIRLWRVATGQPLRALTCHSSIVMSLAWSADQRYLASGGADNMILVWDLLNDDDCTTPFRMLTGHSRHVMVVTFTAQNDLLSGGRDGTTRYWPL